MRPLRGQMQDDGRIFDPETEKFTYRIEENGEVRDLQRSGGIGGIFDPKPGVHMGRIDKDGYLWEEGFSSPTHKIEQDGRVWDLISGSDKPDWIEGYGAPSKIGRPVSAPGFGGGGGGGIGLPIPIPIPNGIGVLVLLMWIWMWICVLIGLLIKGCEYTVLQADRGINKIYPAYETREEGFLEHTQKWEQWKRFAQSSEKWLLTSETVPAMPDGKIIFLFQINKNQRIYQMNLQNKRQIRLPTRFTGEITAYAVSPEGEEIGLVATREGRSSEIYRVDSSGRAVRLTETTDGYGYKDLTWLSSSVILATRQIHPYVRTIWQVEASSIPGTQAIVAMRIPTYEEYNSKWVNEANRAGPKTFYNCERPSVSPDGTKLAYIRTEYHAFGHTLSAVRGAGDIVVRDLQNNKEFVYDFVNAIRLTPQAFAPDGSKIAFSGSDREGISRIGILELEKSWWPLSRSKVSWLRVAGQNPVWSGDGRWIAFDNEGEVYIFDISTGQAKTEPNSVGFLTGSEVRIVDGNVGKIAKGEKPLWIP